MANIDSVRLAEAVKDVRPKRKKDFIWRKMGGEAILFNPATNETYMLNQTGAAVWELCNGEHSIESIADAFAERFEAERAEIIQDISEFIAEGKQNGYITSE